jgi:hypothetical protein
MVLRRPLAIAYTACTGLPACLFASPHIFPAAIADAAPGTTRI